MGQVSHIQGEWSDDESTNQSEGYFGSFGDRIFRYLFDHYIQESRTASFREVHECGDGRYRHHSGDIAPGGNSVQLPRRPSRGQAREKAPSDRRGLRLPSWPRFLPSRRESLVAHPHPLLPRHRDGNSRPGFGGYNPRRIQGEQRSDARHLFLGHPRRADAGAHSGRRHHLAVRGPFPEDGTTGSSM